MTRIAIIGAGPAGMSAACTLAAHGHQPLVVDEAQQPGGQVYRLASAPVMMDKRRLLGSQATAAAHLHDRFTACADRIEFRPATSAWNVYDSEIHTVHSGRAEMHGFDALILATGATDRLLPVPGWTLPGVFTLGGAQTLLKDQGCVIGRNVVFAGASPLLYLAALQYSLAGCRVAAVLDTTPFSAKLAALPRLTASLATLSRGLAHVAALRRRGVPIHHGVRLQRIDGEGVVASVLGSDAGGRPLRIEADAVALGFGLRAEVQLLELAGAQLRYDPVFRQFLPVMDSDGRCGPGIYAAGDGAAFGGADAAICSGQLAAYAILRDQGAAVPESGIATLRARFRRLRRFQHGLAKAFVWPAHWLSNVGDDAVLCRCEGVTLGEVRNRIRADLGPRDVNRAKALTRCGMGRCQGRFCGNALAEVMAQECGRPLEQFGWLRAQAPVKPLPLTTTPVE